MQFKGLIPLSLIDYPGKMAAVAHTGGCNFRCGFCYNRALVLEPERLPSIDEDDVLAFLQKRKRWLDALCVTGGEPTIHPALPAFARRVKAIGVLLQLQTNGSNPTMLEELIAEGLVDYVAMDVKAPLDWERYARVAGIVDRGLLARVRRSIRILLRGDVDYEFRTTYVPALLSADDIVAIAKAIEGAERYAIQQFVPLTTVDATLEGSAPASRETLEAVVTAVAPLVRRVELRGVAF